MTDALNARAADWVSKMAHKVDFSTASSEVIIEALCKRLDEIRLSRNLSQSELAAEAGVSRRTLTRLADGQPISLDSFVRIMQALRLGDHLAALLPDPAVRPVERVRLEGAERRRASGRRAAPAEWQWGDEGGEE